MLIHVYLLTGRSYDYGYALIPSHDVQLQIMKPIIQFSSTTHRRFHIIKFYSNFRRMKNSKIVFALRLKGRKYKYLTKSVECGYSTAL